MSFLEGFSREALAAANLQPRVGWYVPAPAVVTDTQVPLKFPAVVCDSQRVTDIAIASELFRLCSLDERTDLLGLLAEDEWTIVDQAPQRGGLHSDPMIRTISVHAWSRRDLDWTPAQVAIDNARELVVALERAHRAQAPYDSRAVSIPPGTFEIAPPDFRAVGWPPDNWPYVYRRYLRSLKITNIEGSANKYIRTRSSIDWDPPMQQIPRERPSRERLPVYEGPYGAQRPQRDHSPNTRLTNRLAEALSKALGVHGVPPTSKK